MHPRLTGHLTGRGGTGSLLAIMNPRVIVSAVLAVGILVLALAGASLMVRFVREPEAAKPIGSVTLVRAPEISARPNHRMVIEGFGSTRASEQVQIVPEVLGRVVWRSDKAFSGQFVTRGQELFRIERKDYELARQSAAARADLLAAQLAQVDQEQKNLQALAAIEAEREKLAKKILDDTRTLRADDAVSASDLDQAEEAYHARRAQRQTVLNSLALIEPRRLQIQAEHAAAKAQLTQADVNLARATYLSPVTGRIRTWDVPAEQPLQAGRTYGLIYATGVMEIPVPVAAEDLQWLDRSVLAHGRKPTEKDKTVTVTWHGKTGDRKRWTGYVDRIEAGLAERTRTAVLVVRVANAPDNPAAMLDINMFCRVQIPGRTVGSVFVIPRSAVGPDRKVYVVVDGKLDDRDVEVMRFRGDDALIRVGGGLIEGDRVVTSYLAKPQPGMPVTLAGETARDTASGAGGTK